MMRKILWISFRKLKIHEFNATLRYVKNAGATWKDVFIQLNEITKKNVRSANKLSWQLLLAYFLLRSFSDNTSVSITVQNITASIPTPFVTLTTSLILFFLVLYLLNIFCVMSVTAREANNHRLRRFSSAMYGQYMGQDELAFTTPIIPFGFLKEYLPVLRIVFWFSAIIMAVVFLPVLAFLWYVFTIQANVLLSAGHHIFLYIVAAIGIFINGFTLFYLVFFHFPLPYRKDWFSIRWGFLVRLYAQGKHPMVKLWLSDKRKHY